MAIKIYFDAQRNPEKPTFNLATRRGIKYAGILPAENIVVSDRMNDVSEVTFKIRKYADGVKYHLWDYLKDFKLLYCREWNMWLETKVELDESTETIKTVYGTNLGRSELTNNAILHNIEINTELDISRDDYDPDYPTIIYRPNNHPEASLLHRIMEKVPSYKVRYVSPSIANLQRVFTFDGVSVYEAFKQIEEELDCIFVFHTAYEDGSICREISVYDLHSWCGACGHRGEFFDVCPECENTGKEDEAKPINHGYGNDTTIFVTSDELADNIQYVTDTDSVKNKFYLEAGDDLMTATIRNCTPDGSGYLWGITDETKEDMSKALRDGLEAYDEEYDYYQNTYGSELNSSTVAAYNDVVTRYKDKYDLYVCNYCGKKFPVKDGAKCPNCGSTSVDYSQSLGKIDNPVVGYSKLVKSYYDTVDFALFLQSSMMPSVEFPEVKAIDQIQLLQTSLSQISVQNINIITPSTINSSILSMAKAIVDSRYEVRIDSSTAEADQWEKDENGEYVTGSNGEKVPTHYKWTGFFTITNYSDETDTASTTYSNGHVVDVDSDYENFVKQKLDKVLSKADTKDMSISGLFELSEVGGKNGESSPFAEEISKYCLARLTSFRDACQSCLDILIEHGVAEDRDSDIYMNLYVPYYNKMKLLDAEIKVRQNDINTITGIQDANGKITQHGIQTYLIEAIEFIQDKLNIQTFLGEQLWKELCSYIREDTYSNDNYISDGLDNQGLFDLAQEFIKEAERELFKSAHLQHTISCSLKNLLVIEKFKPFVDYFELGNWIRVQIDDNVYRLRLISYEIDYDNIQHITVEFSDVMKTMDGMSDAQSVIEQMQTIGGSYSSVKQQAKKGEESKKVLDNWVTNSLSLTNMKIVGNADNQDIVWDTHGLLLRRYYPETDLFDDKQVKFINNGMYFTTDGWETVKTGVGSFMLHNPKTGQTEEAYGVIAETLVGNLILSEEVGVYNTTGSVAIDKNGILVIADATEKANDMSITIQRKSKDENGEIVVEDIFGVDSNGYLYLNGSVKIQTDASDDVTSINDLCSDDRLDASIEERIYNLQSSNRDELEAYKAEVGQYLTFGADGLKIGANVDGRESRFSTVLDNRRLAFKEDGATVAYINGTQMYISNTIIENILAIGNYYFVPITEDSTNGEDVGNGMVVLWKDDIEIEQVGVSPSSLGSFTVLAGESLPLNVSVTGTVESIEWKLSLDNGSSWSIVAYDTTTCTIEMPSDSSVTTNGNYIKVRCTVYGYDGLRSVYTEATITLTDNGENEGTDESGSGTTTVTYTVNYNLKKCTCSNMVGNVAAGQSYSTTLMPNDGYAIDSNNVTVTMGGNTISCYSSSTGEITINEVTGDIVINATATLIDSGGDSGGGDSGNTGDDSEEFRITEQPKSISVSVNERPSFTVTTNKPNASSNHTFMWYTRKPGTTSWGQPIKSMESRFNTDTYYMSPVTKDQNGLEVRCIVSFEGVMLTSDTATLEVLD